MRTTPRLLLISALALLGACSYAPRPFQSAAAPPPPLPPRAPMLTGALVAPERGAEPVYSGSSMAPVLAPGSAVRLSANDSLALFSNNTAIGLTDRGTPYAVFFSGDGAAHFGEGRTADLGTWRVLPDGELCSRLPRVSTVESCYIVARYGDVILFQSQDGLAVGSVRVVTGNPQSL